MLVISGLTVLTAAGLLYKTLKQQKIKALRVVFTALCLVVMLPYSLIFADSIFGRVTVTDGCTIEEGNAEKGENHLVIKDNNNDILIYGLGGIAEFAEKADNRPFTLVYLKHLHLVDSVYRQAGQYRNYIYHGSVYWGIPFVIFLILLITYKFITGVTNDIYFRYKWKFYKGMWGSGEAAFDNVASGIVVKEDYK